MFILSVFVCNTCSTKTTKNFNKRITLNRLNVKVSCKQIKRENLDNVAFDSIREIKMYNEDYICA